MATSDYTSKVIEIPLTKGYVAIVDELDADLLKCKWFTQNPNRRPYAARQIYREGSKRQKTILLHCVIAEKILGRQLEEHEQVDHWDNNSLNNRRENLRITDGFGNAKNKPRYKSNTTGYKGVWYHKQNKKWVASISVNKKRIFLGSYSTPELAYQAYCEAAIKYHGEYARFE